MNYTFFMHLPNFFCHVTHKTTRIILPLLLCMVSSVGCQFQQTHAAEGEVSNTEIFSVGSFVDSRLEGGKKELQNSYESTESFFSPYIDRTITWYDERNIEMYYLKGIVRIKALDFLLLVFGFISGGYMVMRFLIKS